MVVTDEPEQSPPRRQVSALRMASGVGLAIAVLAVLGNLTAVDLPEEPPATTLPLNQPTTTAVFTEQGNPLELEMVLSREGRAPLGVVEHGGLHYLFLAAGSDEHGWSVGVETLVSADGVSWESRGVVIDPPARVESVVGSDAGFLTYTYGPHQGAIVLWVSDDGVDWRTATAPLEDGETAFLSSVQLTEEFFLLVGQDGGYTDLVWDSVSEAMQERYDVGYGQLDTYQGPDGAYSVTWWGPLGIPLVVTTPEELGIKPDELMATPDVPSRTWLWSSADGVEWQRTEVPELDHVQEVVVESGGLIRLVGYSRGGVMTSVASSNRTTWEVSGRSRTDLSYLQRTGDGWVASSTHSPDLLFSADMEEWESAGVKDLFGSSRQWYVSQMIAAERWTAAIVSSMSEDVVYVAPEPLEVERSGFVLKVTDSSLSLTKMGTDQVVLHVSRWATSSIQRVHYDHHTRTVSFLAPETGEVLISLGMEELEALETRWGGGGGYEGGDPLNVLLLSEDMDEWTTQEIETSGDRQSFPMSMYLTEHRILIVVGWYDPRAEEMYGFELWRARLPSG